MNPNINININMNQQNQRGSFASGGMMMPQQQPMGQNYASSYPNQYGGFGTNQMQSNMVPKMGGPGQFMT